MSQNSSYPIRSYGLIGNRASAALVSPNGSVDWCCLPHPDSTSHFGTLLDSSLGGSFQAAPLGSFRSHQTYRERSAVLETHFETDTGKGILTDWMPLDTGLEELPSVFREVHTIEGEITWRVYCHPRFDYGAHASEIEQLRHGFRFRGPKSEQICTLTCSQSLRRISATPWIEAQLKLNAGERAHLQWIWGRHRSLTPTPSIASTLKAWKGWAHECPPQNCPYAGPWHDTFVRSQICLKILSLSSLGIPAESITPFMDDPRLIWLKNAAQAAQVFSELNQLTDLSDVFETLGTILLRDSTDELRPTYSLDAGKSHGDREWGALPSHRKLHLTPYGQILLALGEAAARIPSLKAQLTPNHWNRLSDLTEHVAQIWRRPDIPWNEPSARAEHFVHSKLACWAGLDSSIRLKGPQKTPQRWLDQREILKQTILSQGYSSELGCFVSHFGSHECHASWMEIPLRGLLPFDDPRIESSIRFTQERLLEGVLVRNTTRLSHLFSNEELDLAPSFQYASCLARSGKLEQASDHLAELCTATGELQIWGSRIDRDTLKTSGNFPSSQVCLALMAAVLEVARARSLRKSENDDKQASYPGTLTR